MTTRNPGVYVFAAVIVGLIAIAMIITSLLEKRKRNKVNQKFKNFSSDFKVSQKNARSVPRVTVPPALSVLLTLTDDEYFGFKARALDVSFTGFSVKPDFPLKRLPINIIIKNVMVTTPINHFIIREMKTVRFDHQVDMRLLAFQIVSIDDDQAELLKTFISYLDEFVKMNGEDD